MADIKNSKLSAAPSPIPSSKSPLPPLDSEGNPVVDPDADMEDDPDVITKVCLNFSLKTCQHLPSKRETLNGSFESSCLRT